MALSGAAVVAAAWLAPVAAGQSGPPFPACPPTTTPLPPPAVAPRNLTNDDPARLVVGRPFTMNYDESAVVVQDTASSTPGVVIDDPTYSDARVTVAAAGPAAFTVRYLDLNATRANACVWSADFTVTVEAGDPVVARLGAIEGPEPRWPRAGPPRLPARGILVNATPLVGARWTCTGTIARVPVVAELFVERRLARSPTEASPVGRLTVADPCGTQPVQSARAPGALLRFYGEPDVDVGERSLTATIRHTTGARYWLRITQAGRLVGQSRFFAAFRSQNGRFPDIWVVAPEASFEAARCRRPRRGDDLFPLGFRKWPIPPCRR